MSRLWSRGDDSHAFSALAAGSLIGLRFAHPQVQFSQLTLSDIRRRVGEQTVCILRLWKRHHVADRTRATHQHDQAIEAERQTTIPANMKPSRILPTSPMKTFATGMLNGRNPMQHSAIQILKVVSEDEAVE